MAFGRRRILGALRRWEPTLRLLGSRWGDGLPPDVRFELLKIANEMQRILISERRARPRGRPRN